MSEKFYSKAETGQRTSLHPVTCMRKGQDPDDDFPTPIQITEKRVGFVASEVDAWIERRISEARRVAVAAE